VEGGVRVGVSEAGRRAGRVGEREGQDACTVASAVVGLVCDGCRRQLLLLLLAQPVHVRRRLVETCVGVCVCALGGKIGSKTPARGLGAMVSGGPMKTSWLAVSSCAPALAPSRSLFVVDKT